MGGDGNTEPMSRVVCKDESGELHDLIERNLDLIPGDQINPTEPRRWLLIKREMPVPDPATGGNRWRIYFLMADQDAVPTFVECKRFGDTRTRREVIGQMLEYAANPLAIVRRGSSAWVRNHLGNRRKTRLLQHQGTGNLPMLIDQRLFRWKHLVSFRRIKSQSD